MATKRMCPQTVTLYNYIGEVDRRATYLTTVLHNVKCIVNRGASSSTQGRGEADTAKLYIFDNVLYATNDRNEEVRYLPHEDWVKLEDKSGYWSLSPNGDDFFFDAEEEQPTIAGVAVVGNCFAGYGDLTPYHGRKFRVKSFKRLDQGSRRLAHFEVDGG